MMKDSIVFYKSFYEAIRELPTKNQLDIYNAIFQKYFYGKEIELKGISQGIFNLIIPNVDSANKRYFANCENGKRGGAPIGNQNAKKTTQKQPKNNPSSTQKTTQNNLNDNDNDNDNVNDNDNSSISSNNLYNYIESNFGRLLSPIEYQEISSWEDNELTRYAIKQAVLNGKYNIKYISKILLNYEKNSIKTVQQAQVEEKRFKGEKDIPDWLNKNIEPELATKEEQEEFDNFLKNYN